jgi:ABC-2 type transport system permease protein
VRFLIVFRKTLQEMKRDLWVVGLTLAFAPLFVWLYWLWFQGGSTSYRVLVINHDQGVTLPGGSRFVAGDELVEAIREVTYADGKPLLSATHVDSIEEAENLLRERAAVAFVEIPTDFSQTILALQAGDRSVSTKIVFGGDLTNPYYTFVGVLAITAIEGYVQGITGQQPIIQYIEQPLGASGARTEFEIYVPGVMIFAVIMLVFQAAMSVAREIESGALQRLRLTPMTAFDLLGGITTALLLVGIAAILLTFVTAVALGFHSQGSLWTAMLIGTITTLSIIGIGMIVACFTRSVSQAFVVANFPLGLLMFFSGAIFPVPPVKIFTIGERVISLYDLLPPTHAVAALNKILTLGASPGEVVYELGMLAALSLLYFGIGVVIFQRLQMRRG